MQATLLGRGRDEDQFGTILNLRPKARVSLKVPLTLIAKLMVLQNSAHDTVDHEASVNVALEFVKARYISVRASGSLAVNYPFTLSFYFALALGFATGTELFADAINVTGIFLHK